MSQQSKEFYDRIRNETVEKQEQPKPRTIEEAFGLTASKDPERNLEDLRKQKGEDNR